MNPFFRNSPKSMSKHMTLEPGVYDSTVLRIDDSNDGGTFTVLHAISVGRQAVIAYPEKFSAQLDNPRTQALLSALRKVGITVENFDDYVGCRERLTLGYEYRQNCVYLNVLERQILSEEEVPEAVPNTSA